ncbi:MAG: DUF58 domain-containing protein [Demequinaceae bacterium]|nr:DUF58 domain-containing protein [Demequinaceae bacterium]
MATRAKSEVVLTSRGIGLSASGVVVAGLGVGMAAPPLVYIGVAMVTVVAVAGLWMLLAVNSFLARFPYARRDVVPRPLTVGTPGRVTVSISSASKRSAGASVRRALTEALDIREQASAELTGGLGTKATVSRTPEKLSLSYALLPSRRGRWPLGPALVHSSEPLGILWSDTSVGAAELIPVWPAIVDLSATAGALMGHSDRVVLGARSPSPDDASLREYREGDDLRRVHWPSSARTGTMQVRSDERAGRRPATVLLDTPVDPDALEWSISAAASIAVSVLGSGHPVRLLGGTLTNERARHFGKQHPEEARVQLLNQTIDLASPANDSAAARQLLRAINHAGDDLAQGEVIIGIFNPLNSNCLEALSPLGQAGHAWAIVRSESEGDEAAAGCATALRRSGWRATTAAPHESLSAIWTTLLTAGDSA